MGNKMLGLVKKDKKKKKKIPCCHGNHLGFYKEQRAHGCVVSCYYICFKVCVTVCICVHTQTMMRWSSGGFRI